MGTWGKILGTASVVTGAIGAIAAGGVTAQRRAVGKYRRLAAEGGDVYDALTPDRSYTVASADGVSLYVEEVGPADAPLTVVFAHGWTLRMGSWHYQRIGLSGSGFGEPGASPRSPQARLVFYDQRSHGQSGRALPGRSTLPAIGEDLAAVIATAAPDGPVVLVGHSMGGMAILALAAAEPELIADRVVGVALVDTSAYLDSGKTRRPTLMGGSALVRAFTATASRYPRMFERGRPATRDAVWLLTRNFGFADPQVPTQVVDYVDQMIADTPIEVIAEFLPAVLAHDLRDGLTALAPLPAVVICGSADRMLPVAQSEALAQALPLAELVIVPGAGHNVMLENPTATTEALRELLWRAASEAGIKGAKGHRRAARADDRRSATA